MTKALLVLYLFLFSYASYAQGVVLAGIEIGSRGVKASAVRLIDDPKSDEYTVEKLYRRTINPDLVRGMRDGLLQEDRIAAARKAVEEVYSELKTYAPESIVVVASTAFERVQNRGALAIAIKEATGQDLEFIRADEEIYYAMLAAVPKRRLHESVLIDVGSGNTKAGYASSASATNFESITLPFGTVTLKEAARTAGAEDFTGSLERILREQISPAARATAVAKPGLATPNKRIYIIGGASWAAATLARPQDIEKPYVRLRLEDLQALATSLASANFSPNHSDPAIQKEINQVRDVFTTDDLRSGIGILRSILAAWGAAQRLVVFPRAGAEGGWLYGYMFAKFNDRRASVPESAPPSSQQGPVLAGIEIGSRGIKASAVRLLDDPKSDEYSVERVYRRTINPDLIRGMRDGLLQEDRIAAAKAAIQEIFAELQAINPQRIFVVASTAFERIQNRGALSIAVKEATGQDLEFIKAEEEIYYAMLAAVPKRRLSDSILIDIGSGNTKAGYASPNAINNFASVTVPFGTVTLKEAARSADGGEGLRRIVRDQVEPAFRQAVENHPGLGNPSRRIYIIGGASWAATALARPSDAERPYVRIRFEEIDALLTRLAEPNFAPSSANAAAHKEISQVMDVFSKDDLRAGISILRAALSGFGGLQRTIIFPRVGAEGGWLYGYMFGRYNAQLAPNAAGPTGRASAVPSATSSRPAVLR